jgi:hypothetical protein
MLEGKNWIHDDEQLNGLCGCTRPIEHHNWNRWLGTRWPLRLRMDKFNVRIFQRWWLGGFDSSEIDSDGNGTGTKRGSERQWELKGLVGY